MIDKKLRNKLIEVAKKGGTIAYWEIADMCHLNLNDPKDREIELPKLLGNISKEEVRNGRPMLSVVAIHKNTPKMPGDGFFELAKELGKLKRGESRDVFFANEYKEVCRYWKERKV